MPQSKIWGIAASGLADGEGDLESYNSMVESVIREPSKPRMRRVGPARSKRGVKESPAVRPTPAPLPPSPAMIALAQFDPVVQRALCDRMGLPRPRKKEEWED